MGAQRATDLSSLAGGRGPATQHAQNQTRSVTARGTVAIAPNLETDPVVVTIDTLTGTYGQVIPAGNWSPRGARLPQVGDSCLVVYDDQGDAFMPVGGNGMTTSGAFSPGDVKLSAVAVVPAGWLTCDGTAYLQSDYPDLFAALGSTGSVWGHDSTHFNVPDLRGRAPIGAGTGTAPDATAHALGATTGTENTTLMNSQMPVHSHTGVTNTDSPDHTHSFNVNSGYVSNDHTHGTAQFWMAGSSGTVAGGTGVTVTWYGSGTGGISANHYHNVAGGTGGASARHAHGIYNDGGGAAHTNMQPTTAVNYLIKT